MTAAVAAVVAAMVLIQAGAALGKGLFPAVGPVGASGLRLALGTVILAAVFRPWRRSLSARERLLVAGYGTVLGLMNVFFYLAVARVPLGIVVAVEFAGPLTVAVLGSRRALDLVWAVLAAAGIALVLPLSEATGGLDPAGLGFAAAAGACWGLYIVLGRRLGSVAPGTATSMGMLVATAVVLPAAAGEAGARLLDPALLPLAATVALLSAVPYLLEMFALRHMPERTFGIFMSAEPVIAGLTGLAVLGERLTPAQIAATACVVAASAGSALGHE